MPNWSEILGEINDYSAEHQRQSRAAIDHVRRSYLRKLHDHTGRNIIAYYSGWLSKPGILQADINDEDKNGFMMAVHQLDRNLGLDLILHTPGGSMAATESLVDYMHKMFANNIRSIVPQIAMSAGTMVACSTSAILMCKHSNLGPIDPHLAGIPAAGVIEEFQRAWQEVKSDPSKIPIWQSIISQYRPTFLSQCENGVQWAKDFVTRQLESVMFAGQPDAKQKADHIVDKLSSYAGNKSHERHIPIEECEAMGLKIERVERQQKLQDLVLAVHHCFMHSLMNTNAFKIIENHRGTAFIKAQRSN